MGINVAQAFKSLAIKLGVEESDFLVLVYGAEIATQDSYFYKVPQASDLEDFLRLNIFPNAGFESDGNVEIFGRYRIDTVSWADWKRSNGAAALRKLWDVSKTVARAELRKLTEDNEDEPPKKVNRLIISDMREKAASRGVPEFTEFERPGRICIGKLVKNFGVGGAFEHVPWESYTSEEEEERAHRLGLTAKTFSEKMYKFEGQLGETMGEIKRRTTETVPKSAIEDMMSLQDCSKIRSVAHEYLEVVRWAEYEKLTQIYVSALRQRVPEMMRTPTLGEIRMLDRMIHEEVFSYAGRGQGSLSDGLAFYMGEGRVHPVWNIILPQVGNLPDQSREGASKGSGVARPGGAVAGLVAATVNPRERAGGGGGAGANACSECGKARNEHVGRRFCQRVGDATAGGKSSGGKGKKDKKSGKGAKRDAKEQGLLPDGCATRTAPNLEFPSGQRYCVSFHKSGTCDKAHGSCVHSHKCPKFGTGGAVCGQNHAACKHTD
jgi:hypothetical protein